MSDRLHLDLPEGEEKPPAGVRAAAVVRWALVLAMAVIAVVSLLYSTDVLGPDASTVAAVQYQCPMHPAIVRDGPGNCPICGMDLVPVARAAPSPAAAPPGHAGHAPASLQSPEAAGVPGLAPIDLDSDRVQLIGLRTAPVERRVLAPELRTVGYVAANERGLAQVHTRFAGWIETLPVAATGQRVRRGETLATIYSPALLTTQQELLAARAWSEVERDSSEAARVRRTLAEGARRRLELSGIARDEIRHIERTGEPLRALPLRSPIDGYVVEKTAVAGLYVEPGTMLFRIADLSTLWVLADVSEGDIGRIREGAPAELDVAAAPGRTLNGTVDFLYPTLDANTRTLRVRLVFPNPDLTLRPGMYGDVRFAVASAPALVVPREALVDTGTQQYVFVARPGGRFEPRRVRVGGRAPDAVEILEGVREGEAVVTTANFLLDSESRLRAALTGGDAPAAGAAAVHSHPQ